MTYKVNYALYIYDSDDTTLLTPATGADHSDVFSVFSAPFIGNACSWSDSLANWSASGASATNSRDFWNGYAPSGWGGIALCKVASASSFDDMRYHTVLSTTLQNIGMDGSPALLTWYEVEPDSAAASGHTIYLRDTSGSTDFIDVDIQWVNGSPRCINEADGVFLGVEEVTDSTSTLGRRLFRLVARSSLDVDDTHSFAIRVHPTGVNPTENGDVIIGGVQLNEFREGEPLPLRKHTTGSAATSTYQPIINRVSGRRGRLDPMSGEPDSGYVEVDVVDRIITPGGSNLQRWVTAFLGDDDNRQQIRGRRALLLESLDYGISQIYYIEGRVNNLKLSSDKLTYTFQIRDRQADLEQEIFIGAPTSSATHGFQSRVFPFGLPSGKTYGESGGWNVATFKCEDRDSFVDSSGQMEGAILKFNKDSLAPVLHRCPKALEALHEESGGATADMSKATNRLFVPTLRVKVGSTWWYYVRGIEWDDDEDDVKKIKKLLITELPSEDPDASAIGNLVIDTSYNVEIFPCRNVPASENAPILIEAANVEDLVEEILDGYYGPMATDGTALQIAIAHPTYSLDARTPAFRAIITEPMTIKDFLTDYIAGPYRFGYFLDEAGLVQLTDLRLPTSAPANTITDTSVVSTSDITFEINDTTLTKVIMEGIREEFVQLADYEQMWEYIHGERFNRFRGKDNSETQSPPPHLVMQYPFQVIVLGGDNTISYQEKRIKAHSIRAGHLLKTTNNLSEERIQEAWLEEVANAYLAAYGTGQMTYSIPCRRILTDGNPYECEIGDLRIIDVDALPDVATLRRGGARIARCIERYVDSWKGDLVLTFEDCGLQGQCTAPTSVFVDALNSASYFYNSGVRVDFTTNADADDIEVWYNVTTTGTGTIPSASDGGWTLGGRYKNLNASTTYYRVVNGFAPGLRVWVKVRSVAPDGTDGIKMPSDFVEAGAPGYEDIPALTVPTSLTSAGVNATSALLTWSIGTTYNRKIVVRVDTTNPPPASGCDFRAILPVGSTRLFVENLTASTTYYWTVAFLESGDSVSRQSSVANFTTTATTPDCPDMSRAPVAFSNDLYA